MSSPWKVAVVGLGAMGQHHVRVVSSLPDHFELVAVYDSDSEACQRANHRYGATIGSSVEELIEKAEVVYVATPTRTHFEVASLAIKAGRHVFIEKPIAPSVSEGNQLVDLADQYSVRIGVGHTERFNPAVVWLRTRLLSESVLSVNIERVGPRPPRIKDVGIVTDLAVHDLDLISYLTNSPLKTIRCVGNHTSGEHEDVAQIVVSTQSQVVGSINTNWLTPFKSRSIHVATSEGFFEADLLRSIVRVYTGDKNDLSRYSVEEPWIRWAEPLQAQALAFSDFLHGNDASGTVNGKRATQVLGWVEACLHDLKHVLL